jgi:cytochrome c556
MRASSPIRRALVAIALGLLAISPAATGQDQTKAKRRQVMRQKLEYSKGILEGLTREDYALVAESARSLKLLSKTVEWGTPSIPNAEQFAPLTTEFQRLCDELSKRAIAKNIDGATLVYMQLTMNCVTCHKYVRGARD